MTPSPRPRRPSDPLAPAVADRDVLYRRVGRSKRALAATAVVGFAVTGIAAGSRITTTATAHRTVPSTTSPASRHRSATAPASRSAPALTGFFTQDQISEPRLATPTAAPAPAPAPAPISQPPPAPAPPPPPVVSSSGS